MHFSEVEEVYYVDDRFESKAIEKPLTETQTKPGLMMRRL